jgi:hypothetical protein
MEKKATIPRNLSESLPARVHPATGKLSTMEEWGQDQVVCFDEETVEAKRTTKKKLP